MTELQEPCTARGFTAFLTVSHGYVKDRLFIVN